MRFLKKYFEKAFYCEDNYYFCKSYREYCYMPISSTEQQYIENKHRGGVNNSKGNAYENFYAIYKISDLLLRHKDHLKEIIIDSQIKAAIDDLYVKEISHLTYYQLKNVLKLSWEYGSTGHSLKEDCILQNKISEEKSEDFRIVIVFSHRNCESLLLPLPVEISSYTSIEFFPLCDSVNQLLLGFNPFLESIKGICSIDDPKNDDLLNIAQVLLGIWCGYSSAVNLDAFYKDLMKYDCLPIIGFQTESISEKCKSLFDVYEINYRIVENKLIWQTKDHKLQGRMVWNEQKDLSLINSDIKSLRDLISKLIE